MSGKHRTKLPEINLTGINVKILNSTYQKHICSFEGSIKAT